MKVLGPPYYLLCVSSHNVHYFGSTSMLFFCRLVLYLIWNWFYLCHEVIVFEMIIWVKMIDFNC